jgi:DNA repair protein RadC
LGTYTRRFQKGISLLILGGIKEVAPRLQTQIRVKGAAYVKGHPQQNTNGKKMKTIPHISLKKTQTSFEEAQIISSKQAADYIKQFYFDDIEIYESFFILLLNNANKTIGYAKISQGGVAGTSVDIRIIAKYAVEALATAVILAHNHPSGNLSPSQSDKAMTNKIKEGLKILDIQVFDHVILTVDGHYSFADSGLL